MNKSTRISVLLGVLLASTLALTTDQILTRSYSSADNALRVNLVAGGGGDPGGSDTQVQYNDAGVFGGDAGFVYNKTTDSATLVGTVAGGTLTEGGNAVPNATNHLGFFAATTSAQLAGVISDETGSGALVFATSPTFTTSAISPLWNATGTATSTTAANSADYLGNGIVYEGATANAFEATVTVPDPAADHNMTFIRQFSATYDPASLAAGEERCDDVAVTGIVADRVVAASPGASNATGCVLGGVWASSTGFVTVCWSNTLDAVAACDVASSTWTFMQPAGAS